MAAHKKKAKNTKNAKKKAKKNTENAKTPENTKKTPNNTNKNAETHQRRQKTSKKNAKKQQKTLQKLGCALSQTGESARLPPTKEGFVGIGRFDQGSFTRNTGGNLHGDGGDADLHTGSWSHGGSGALPVDHGSARPVADSRALLERF